MTYEYDFGDGAPKIIASSSQDHLYRLKGQYYVTLTVTDSRGRTDSAVTPVTIT